MALGGLSSNRHFDVAIAGGGLAGSLIALRLSQLRPDLSVVVVERARQIGGNHTWSFHHGDVTAAQLAWLGPLIAYSWPSQRVRFPAHAKHYPTPYHSITSDRLRAVMTPILRDRLTTGREVAALAPGAVILDGGSRIEAACVIDARGMSTSSGIALGYQKFIGLECETEDAHAQDAPIIMDATVPQTDGYRFVYTLPLDRTRLLIEDTFYSDSASIDEDSTLSNIERYASGKGWGIGRQIRRERGVLPIVLAGRHASLWPRGELPVPKVGLRAGLFHPTTGYSLPDAARVADLVATVRPLTSEQLYTQLRRHSGRLWRDRSFFRLLNRFLFVAARPSERLKVMERFFTLPEHVVANFYAARLSPVDMLRIVTGKPPIPIPTALRCFSTAGAWRFAHNQRGTAGSEGQ